MGIKHIPWPLTPEVKSTVLELLETAHDETKGTKEFLEHQSTLPPKWRVITEEQNENLEEQLGQLRIQLIKLANAIKEISEL